MQITLFCGLSAEIVQSLYCKQNTDVQCFEANKIWTWIALSSFPM